jgi:branched-chain amino acid aminotransferase
VERPPVLWFNGRLVSWDEGVVHVWSEVAIRGTNVFEGLRAYWDASAGCHRLVSLEAHLARLFQSARLLRLPTEHVTAAGLRDAVFALIGALGERSHLYVRPTIYVEEGRHGHRSGEMVMGAYVVAFPVPRALAVHSGIRCCVSSWRRASDAVFPPRIKAGAAYLAFRLSSIEASERGCDEAILLDQAGDVAEATGASVFVVRDGVVYTPPVSSSILESITRRHAIRLLAAMGVDVRERAVNRTELHVADEVFLTGTLAEITPVVELDGRPVAEGLPGPVAAACRDRYLAICEGREPDVDGWLTVVPGDGRARRCL